MVMAMIARRPHLDESEWEELGEKLGEAKQEEIEMILTVWGESTAIRGRIRGLPT